MTTVPSGTLVYASTMAQAVVETPGGDCVQENMPSTASCSGSYYTSGDGGNFFELVDGSAAAAATYGIVGVSAIISASMFDTVGAVEQSGTASSQASFSDTATLYASQNTAGTIQIQFTLPGEANTVINPSSSQDSDTHGYAYADAQFLGDAALTESTGPVTGPITDTFTIPFDLITPDPVSGKYTASVPFGILLSAFTGCTAEGEASSDSPPQAGTCSAGALYYDTLRVDSLNAVDADGNLLNGVTISTASDTDYNDLPAEIAPEPSTFFLTGVGLLILNAVRGTWMMWRTRKVRNLAPKLVLIAPASSTDG